MKECTRCGKCCTNASFMGTLSATGDDVKRWTAECRWDILRFVWALGNADNPWGDLWVDEAGIEKSRCPFVRKDRGKPTYRCTIYETRPQVCRNYVPFSGEPNDLCEEV
jgi:Fe-S-cluster containining protein